jgi:hypothetical protein
MPTIDQLIRKAERGDASAQYALGDIYEHGKGETKNDIEAEKWYLKAAEQGDVSAQIALALLYSQGGEGIPENEVAAAKWTLMVAKSGSPEAQYCMGNLYACGAGVDQNELESVAWFSKAAAQGHTDSLTALGGMDGTQPVRAQATLAPIVGGSVLSRSEVDRKLWAYVEERGLHDKANPGLIQADKTLRCVFLGKTQIEIHQMAKLVSMQVTPTNAEAPTFSDESKVRVVTSEENSFGYIYVLVNSAMPGLLKIGYTDRDPKLRASELSAASGVVVPFIVAYHAEVADAVRAETEIHQALSTYRVSDGREFFAMEVRDAIAIIDSICARHTSGNVALNTEQVFAKQRAEEDRMEEWAGVAAAYLYRHGYIDYKIIRSKLGFQMEYQDSLKVFEILQGRGLVRRDGRSVNHFR